MTGSGKTAAFALPVLQWLHESKPSQGGGTRALILTPTRELASQVEEHLSGLGKHTRVRSATVFGGVNARPQEKALRAGVDVIVATPGRLLDLMGSGHARFDDLEMLVLDEADRMLDMGFLPDVRRILAALPRKRQTLFFSATLPKPIVALAREMLHDPARLDVERPSAPAEGVEQRVLPVPQKLKPALLFELVQRGEVDTALVFTRTKHRANRLADYLGKRGVAVDRIHGNRSQRQREKALADFKDGKLEILVATDIASRGIDVEALPHVINFDVPGQPDDYIHRVGRTARALRTGDALTFAAPEERNELAAIERAVGKKIPRWTILLRAAGARCGVGGDQRHGRHGGSHGRGLGAPAAGARRARASGRPEHARQADEQARKPRSALSERGPEPSHCRRSVGTKVRARRQRNGLALSRARPLRARADAATGGRRRRPRHSLWRGPLAAWQDGLPKAHQQRVRSSRAGRCGQLRLDR
jgi:ATP-dependent RNA helicase RhlE